MESITAILFAGRIKGWAFCKEHLLEMKLRHNATFFCSLNMPELDTESKEFCEFFSIGPDQVMTQETVCPEEYAHIYNAYSQAFHVQNAFDKLEAYSEQHGIKFERVIKYRADFYSHILPDFTQDVSKTSYFLTSAWGGINESMYYGSFASMKAISRFCENIDFLSKNGYFSIDFLTKFNLQRHPCMGDYLNNEEYFGIYISLLAVQGLFQVSFFSFYYISHPARRLDYWTSEYQKNLLRLYTTYKNYVETKDTRFMDDYILALTILFESIKNDKNREILFLEISGITWPMP
jgi:hypothetical protein